MCKVVSVVFNDYISNEVPQEILKHYLIGAKCNFPGTLRLVLKPGRQLKQTGPYLIPPIRWLESFEYYAEFDITCDVK